MENMEDCSNSSVVAMELLQSCANHWYLSINLNKKYYWVTKANFVVTVPADALAW